MQEVREENILKSKEINSVSEEEPLVTTKTAIQRSNSLSEEISQKGRGRPKKEQRPRTGSIDAYLSPRTEKRKLQDSPEEKNKKETKKKFSTEMETGIETNALLAQLLEESRKGREEQGEIRKAIMGLTSKFESIEARTKQFEGRLEAVERDTGLMREEVERSMIDRERAMKRLDSIEEKIGKLIEKNKEVELKGKMIESQMKKKNEEKIGNMEDQMAFNQVRRRSAKEIAEKQSQRKEDNNNNSKHKERRWEEWERERGERTTSSSKE